MNAVEHKRCLSKKLSNPKLLYIHNKYISTCRKCRQRSMKQGSHHCYVWYGWIRFLLGDGNSWAFPHLCWLQLAMCLSPGTPPDPSAESQCIVQDRAIQFRSSDWTCYKNLKYAYQLFSAITIQGVYRSHFCIYPTSCTVKDPQTEIEL